VKLSSADISITGLLFC